MENFRLGNIAALARLLSIVENHNTLREQIVTKLPPRRQQPIILGITGVPGAGKSTLINQLLFELKKDFAPIAVLAFDPSSEFTGGAVLGDRFRMTDHALDDRIYIRSMSNRGHLGGVSAAIYDALLLLSAFGFAIIIVETVGVGQAEVDIIRISDIVLLVLTPGLGDDIQAMKAGILEIGDIFIVNKADLPGADKTKTELLASLSINGNDNNIQTKICSTIATKGTGIADLTQTILKSHHDLKEKGLLEHRRKQRELAHTRQILTERWFVPLEYQLKNINRFGPASDHDLSPYDVADMYFQRMIQLLREGLEG